MHASKWFVVTLLIGASPALGQGTAQTTMPSGPGGSYNSAEPIGSSGRPVATPHSNYSAGAFATPAAPRAVIVRPRRR
jgi:hypothetical protein